MSVSYTCPNPECGVVLKTPNRVPVGKSVKCPKCGKPFVPESGDKDAPAPAGVLKLVDEPKKPDAPPAPKPFVDDDEDAASVKKGYGVIAETDKDKEDAEKNKPSFGEVTDRFKKSARGPAMGLLVMPSNLLTLEGLITGLAGLAMFGYGMWPLVFNDAPPGEEETEEAIVYMMLGVVTLFWGAMVCFGASKMQELASYPWSMVGAVMGVLPLLVGIYAIVMLQNPEVKAGFEEGEGGVDDDTEAEGKKKDDDEEDEEEDEDDDDGDDDDDRKGKKGKAKGKEKEGAGKKPAKKLTKKMSRDEDDE